MNNLCFSLTDKEYKRLEEIEQGLILLFGECGHLTFSFTLTGIAEVVTVKSSLLDKEFDITDYDVF